MHNFKNKEVKDLNTLNISIEDSDRYVNFWDFPRGCEPARSFEDYLDAGLELFWSVAKAIQNFANNINRGTKQIDNFAAGGMLHPDHRQGAAGHHCATIPNYDFTEILLNDCDGKPYSIKELKNFLKAAIKKENYEDAAVCRDKIRELEKAIRNHEVN